MTDVFAYLRVSGPSQIHGDGFRRQFIAIRKFCAANGLRIVRVFKERGVCGETELEGRPALSELFNALEEDGTKTVVIEKIDRLARDVLVFEIIIRDFQRSNYILLSTCEPNLVSPDPNHEFMRTIFAAVARLEKKLLVLKLRGARQRKKARGERGEGRHAYGEKPGEPEVLAIIRGRKKDGGSTRGIARDLNAAGIASRYGKPWNPATIAKILARQPQQMAKEGPCQNSCA